MRPPSEAKAQQFARELRKAMTEMERTLWQGLRRGKIPVSRFRRQVPIGPHITDFVSFPLKCVIDVVPPQETEEAAHARKEKRAYLGERGYCVCEVRAADIGRDMTVVMDALAAAVAANSKS